MLKNICDCLLICYGIKPKNIKRIGKMYNVRVNNKVICKDLLKLGAYGRYKWDIPLQIRKYFKEVWISCFFDCEAHVNANQKQIQAKSVNLNGLKRVKNMLNELGICPSLNGPYTQKIGSPYFVLTIGKEEDLKKYSKIIGFNHSEKVKKLNSVLNSRPDGPMVRRK